MDKSKGGLGISRAEKQAAVLRAIAEHPGWSNRAIAKEIGVDHKTVGALRGGETKIPQPSSKPVAWGNSPQQVPQNLTDGEYRKPEVLRGGEISDSPLDEIPQSPTGGEIHKIPTLLDEITTSIPRDSWRETGLALAKGEPVPAEIEALVAELSDSEREELGLALIREFRKPPPRKPWKRSLGPPRQSALPRARVVELRRQGYLFPDIAALLDIPASSARAIVQADARDLLTRHPIRTTTEQRAEVIELRKSGLTYSEIAARTGLNIGTARSIAIAAGLPRNTKALSEGC